VEKLIRRNKNQSGKSKIYYNQLAEAARKAKQIGCIAKRPFPSMGLSGTAVFGER